MPPNRPITGKLYMGIYGQPPFIPEHVLPLHPVRRQLYWRMLYVKRNDWGSIKSWGPVPAYQHGQPRFGTWTVKSGRTSKSRHLQCAIFIADVDSEPLLFTILGSIPLHQDSLNVTEQYIGDAYQQLARGEATIGAPMSMNWLRVLPDVLQFLQARGPVLMERTARLGGESTRASDIGLWAFRTEAWDKDNIDTFTVLVYDVLLGAVSEV